MTALGAGAVLVPATARAYAAGVGNALAAPTASATSAAVATVEPLAVLASGTRLAACTVLSVGSLEHGAVAVTLVDPVGTKFGLEVCARSAVSSAPGRSERFEVFIANEGDGATPTHETHGVSAMALADFLAAHEATIDSAGFLTLEQRLDNHGGYVLRPGESFTSEAR